MSFSDRQLMDYLAGTADDALIAEIETAMAADVALEDRMRGLDPLASVFEGAAFPDVDPDKAAGWIAPPPQPSRSWWPLAAAGIGGAAAVALVAFALNTSSGPDWRADVAVYQALYSAETISPLTYNETMLKAQLDRLGEELGHGDLFALVQSIEGLTPLRAQMLAFDGQPLGQIVFATASGLPVALCLMENTDGSSADVKSTVRAGLASAAFASGEHSWLLIGTDNQELITSTAQDVANQLSLL